MPVAASLMKTGLYHWSLNAGLVAKDNLHTINKKLKLEIVALNYLKAVIVM
jgi:hypothetical protein